MPKAGAGVGIEGIDGVMFGGNDEQVMYFTGDGDGGEIERLGIDQPVGGDGEEFAEVRHIYVCGRKDGFGVVQSGAGVIVVVGEDVLRMGG